MALLDILKVKQYIIDNPHYIEELLSKAGFHSISDRGKEYRCAKDEDGNPNGVKITKDNLASSCYSTGLSGDIITLIRTKKNLSFPNTLKWISGILGIGDEFKEDKNVKLPFGGYFREIKKDASYNTEIAKTIDSKVLNEFDVVANQRFIDDGISIEVQEEFGVGYDALSKRITVPWYSINGELIGVMGRANFEIDEYTPKWFPVIPFEKSHSLYAYHQNYEYVMQTGTCFVGESEKFPLQLRSMGINVGFALGGSHISDFKANCIKSLNPNIIIACYDEGLDEEHIQNQVVKLKSKTMFYQNQVGYIYDRDNKHLPKGSKFSPTDLGKDVFEKLLEECVVWV